MDRLVSRLIVIVALTAHRLRINTTDSQILDRAVGQNVKLECKFTPAPEDAGNLEIEWSIKSVRHPTEKVEILFYGYIYDRNYAPLKRRVYFREEDPRKGDASIELLLLAADSLGHRLLLLPGQEGSRHQEHQDRPPRARTAVKAQVFSRCGGWKGWGNPSAKVWLRGRRCPDLVLLDQSATRETAAHLCCGGKKRWDTDCLRRQRDRCGNVQVHCDQSCGSGGLLPGIEPTGSTVGGIDCSSCSKRPLRHRDHRFRRMLDRSASSDAGSGAQTAACRTHQKLLLFHQALPSKKNFLMLRPV